MSYILSYIFNNIWMYDVNVSFHLLWGLLELRASGECWSHPCWENTECLLSPPSRSQWNQTPRGAVVWWVMPGSLSAAGLSPLLALECRGFLRPWTFQDFHSIWPHVEWLSFPTRVSGSCYTGFLNELLTCPDTAWPSTAERPAPCGFKLLRLDRIQESYFINIYFKYVSCLWWLNDLIHFYSSWRSTWWTVHFSSVAARDRERVGGRDPLFHSGLPLTVFIPDYWYFFSPGAFQCTHSNPVTHFLLMTYSDGI